MLYPAFVYLFKKESRFHQAFRLMLMWSQALTFASGLVMDIKRPENMPKSPYLICPNHGSYLDIITMYRVFSDYFIFMGKIEIVKWPFFGIFFTKGMNISVNRESKLGAHEAFERAKRECDNGHNIVIFPEGTIPTTAPKMRAFKNGAFKLSLEKNIPIVPVTFVNNWRRLQAGPALRNSGGPGIFRVIIHPPVYPEAYQALGVVKMKQDIFEIIEKPLRDSYGDY